MVPTLPISKCLCVITCSDWSNHFLKVQFLAVMLQSGITKILQDWMEFIKYWQPFPFDLSVRYFIGHWIGKVGNTGVEEEGTSGLSNKTKGYGMMITCRLHYSLLLLTHMENTDGILLWP